MRNESRCLLVWACPFMVTLVQHTWDDRVRPRRYSQRTAFGVVVSVGTLNRLRSDLRVVQGCPTAFTTLRASTSASAWSISSSLYILLMNPS